MDNLTTTDEIIRRYGVSRSILVYWRGVSTRPERPAATWGMLSEGKHWVRVGRSVAYTSEGEEIVKRMAKSTRMM